METRDSLQSFADKWLVAWPEQEVLRVFAPESERLKMLAWGALLFELQNCLFALEHEPVREQKTLWWSQELQMMSSQSARHPISQALQHLSAGFAELSTPMLSLLTQIPLRAGNAQQIIAMLQPFAEVLADCEHSLFSGTQMSRPDNIAVQLLVMRLPHGIQAFDRAMIPMNLLARHQSLDSLNNAQALKHDWLIELQNVLLTPDTGNWFRAAQTAFTRRRIRQLGKSERLRIHPGHAWDAWRAMRLRVV